LTFQHSVYYDCLEFFNLYKGVVELYKTTGMTVLLYSVNSVWKPVSPERME